MYSIYYSHHPVHVCITSCTRLYHILYMCMSMSITSCTCLYCIMYMCMSTSITSCTHVRFCITSCAHLCMSYSPHVCVSRPNILIRFHFNSQSPSSQRPHLQAVNGNFYLQEPFPVKTFFFKTTCDCEISNYPFVSFKYFILILLWLALMI